MTSCRVLSEVLSFMYMVNSMSVNCCIMKWTYQKELDDGILVLPFPRIKINYSLFSRSPNKPYTQDHIGRIQLITKTGYSVSLVSLTLAFVILIGIKLVFLFFLLSFTNLPLFSLPTAALDADFDYVLHALLLLQPSQIRDRTAIWIPIYSRGTTLRE